MQKVRSSSLSSAAAHSGDHLASFILSIYVMFYICTSIKVQGEYFAAALILEVQAEYLHRIHHLVNWLINHKAYCLIILSSCLADQRSIQMVHVILAMDHARGFSTCMHCQLYILASSLVLVYVVLICHRDMHSLISYFLST